MHFLPVLLSRLAPYSKAHELCIVVRHLPEWMPGAGFQTFARKCRDMIHEMQDAPFDFVKNNMVGYLLICFMSPTFYRS